MLSRFRGRYDAVKNGVDAASSTLIMPAMKSQLEEGLLRRFRKNAEAIHELEADQAKIRKMLAAIGVTPEGDDEGAHPAPATVHQLRVIDAAARAIRHPATFNAKDMARTALTEVFKNGATNGQMVEFFEKECGKKIRSDSFSV